MLEDADIERLSENPLEIAVTVEADDASVTLVIDETGAVVGVEE